VGSELLMVDVPHGADPGKLHLWRSYPCSLTRLRRQQRFHVHEGSEISKELQ